MRITYYGHACFLVQLGNQSILFDPFITQHPKQTDASLLESLEPDYILLSHGHGDHLGDTIALAKRTGAKVIGVYEVIEWLKKQGVENGIGMNTGGKSKFEFGTLKLVNAVHSSALPDGSYGGNPVGFVLMNDHEGTFYYAGDTALTMDMQLIPMMCPRLDFAILPIGDYFTMGYEDAVLASNFIQCNTIIGCHFDTFPPLKLDHDAAKKAFTQANKTLFLPEMGMTFNIKKKMSS